MIKKKTKAVADAASVIDYLRRNESDTACVWLTTSKVQKIVCTDFDAAVCIYNNLISQVQCVDHGYHWRGHYVNINAS